jgi:Notch-like protein
MLVSSVTAEVTEPISITPFWRLENPDAYPGEVMGYGGPNFSPDQTSFVACGQGYNSSEGRCMVFSESSPGMHDWQQHVQILKDAVGMKLSQLGFLGARWSYEGSHIVSNAQHWNLNEGKLVVWSESALGAKDWQNTTTYLTDTVDGRTNGKLGLGIFAPGSSQFIIACMAYTTNWEGKCTVFSESTPGAGDWNDQQWSIYDSTAAYQNWLGFFGAVMSHDFQSVASCAIGYGASQTGNAFTGKCSIFVETNPGSRDWGASDNRVDLFIPGGGAASDTLGSASIVFSTDSTSALACTPNYNSFQGICIVWSETNIGDLDWGSNKVEMLTDNTAIPFLGGKLGYAKRGESTAMFSTDSQHIVACAYTHESEQGQCIVFSETSPGTQDWNSNQQVLRDQLTGGDFDQFGHAGARFTPDNQYIVACAHNVGPLKGKCNVFWESTPGAQDWANNSVIVKDYFGTTTNDVLGYDGVEITADGSKILACSLGADSNLGACYVFEPDYTNQCDPDPCLYGAACTDWAHNFTCACPAGTTAPICTDLDDCRANPCRNGGNCTDNGFPLQQFNCSCAAGYTGITCRTDIDDCISNPCNNSGVCVDLVDAFECICDGTGYNGTRCALDIDDCASNPCALNGSCWDSGPHSFNCTCDDGYAGALCDEDVNDCISSPCASTGTCSDDGAVANSFSCACDTGYNGTLCANDINDCIGSVCNNGTCSDDGSEPNAFNCTCLPGYTGTVCENSIEECASLPCSAVGTIECVELAPASFNCTCLEHYSGMLCEEYSTPPTACDSSPCLNNGTCSLPDPDNVEVFSCICTTLERTSGRFCEIVWVKQVSEVLVFTITVDSDNITETERVLLERLLSLEPLSIKEQYNITLLPGLIAGTYDVKILVEATTALNNTVLAEAIRQEIEVEPTWIINDEVTGDEPDEEGSDTVENKTDDGLWVWILLVVMAVLCMIALFALLVSYSRRKRKRLRNEDGVIYTIPI